VRTKGRREETPTERAARGITGPKSQKSTRAKNRREIRLEKEVLQVLEGRFIKKS